ncbi:MAG: hypothetical protein WD535_02715 [Thermaerobacterales bacterium]
MHKLIVALFDLQGLRSLDPPGAWSGEGLAGQEIGQALTFFAAPCILDSYISAY